MSVCMHAYSIEQAAGLVKLQAMSCQFRLQTTPFTQQVCHQNTNEVGAAGTRQNLDLHIHKFLFCI